MIKNTEELLKELQEIGNQYQNKIYMRDINKLHQRQNKLVLEAINSILNDLYTTSEGIKKYKSEDSLLTVKQNEIISEKANILPLGTLVILPKNHKLKGFWAGSNLNISSNDYSYMYNAFITKLLKENIPASTKANITSSFEAIKNNSFSEHMYIGSK